MENVGSTTTTAYVLDSNGTRIEAGQGSTVLFLVDDPKGDLSTVMEPGSSIYPACQLQYDPYGTAVFGLSPSNVCETGSTFVDLLYQNGRKDSSSGTYQLGSRTYDPSKNSFLSPDHYQMGTSSQDLSIQVDPLTENAYTYVDGDPVNLARFFVALDLAGRDLVCMPKATVVLIVHLDCDGVVEQPEVDVWKAAEDDWRIVNLQNENTLTCMCTMCVSPGELEFQVGRQQRWDDVNPFTYLPSAR